MAKNAQCLEEHEQRPVGRPRQPLPDVEQPNDFAQWMAERGIDVETVAKLLCVSTAAVYGWRRGNRPPSRKMAVRISRMTDGEVSVESWD
jgi:hypothetical protein